MKKNNNSPINAVSHPTFGTVRLCTIEGEVCAGFEDVCRVAGLTAFNGSPSFLTNASRFRILFSEDAPTSIFLTPQGVNELMEGSKLNAKDRQRFAKWLHAEAAKMTAPQPAEPKPRISELAEIVDSIGYLAKELKGSIETTLQRFAPGGNVPRTYSTTLIADQLGMSAIKLNRFLIEQGIQYKDGDAYELTTPYRHQGLTTRERLTIEGTHGRHDKDMMVWTEAGKSFIENTYKRINQAN